MIRALIWKEFTVRRKSKSIVGIQLVGPIILLFLLKILDTEIELDYARSGGDKAKANGTQYMRKERPLQVLYYTQAGELKDFLRNGEEAILKKAGYYPSNCFMDNKTHSKELGIQMFPASSRLQVENTIRKASSRNSIGYLMEVYGKQMTVNPYTIGAIFWKKGQHQILEDVDLNDDIDIEYLVEQTVDDINVNREEYLFRAHSAILLRIYLFRLHQIRTQKKTIIRIPAMEQSGAQESQHLTNVVLHEQFTSTTVAFIIFVSLTVMVQRVLLEKQTRMKDLFRLSGVTTLQYFASFFIVDGAIVAFLSIIYLLLFELNNFRAYFLILCLHCISATLFALAVTVFFKMTALGTIFYIICNVVCLLTSTMVRRGYKTRQHISFQGVVIFPDWLNMLLSIFAPPMYSFALATHILEDESNERQHLEYSGLLTFGAVCIAQVWACILWLFVIFYIGQVWPWQDGVQKSLIFPFLYMKPKRPLKVSAHKTIPTYYEPPSDESKVTISLNNVKKNFGPSKQVLKGVVLKLCDKQITCLLGHSGAGKSSLMHILTSIYRPTSGQVTINGVDVEDTHSRNEIGFCPQTTVLYEELTVYEHLKLFAMLKGITEDNMQREINILLHQLMLEDKKGSSLHHLSGGLKRRLQLGVAMIGGSKILILDEPTSALDSEARRGIWDLLLWLKKDRLIFMTTHHMEEADCLADRIAVLHRGEIKCCGSTLYLKNTFGLGYCIKVRKAETFDNQQFFSFLQTHFKTVALFRDRREYITYNFAKGETSKLSAFFNALEETKDYYGLMWCRVTKSSLYDVYFRINDLFDLEFEAKERPCSALKMDLKVTAWKQFAALFKKRYLIVKRSTVFLIVASYIFCAAFPIILILHFNPVHKMQPGQNMTIGQFPRKKVAFNCTNMNDDTFCSMFPKKYFEPTENVNHKPGQLSLKVVGGDHLYYCLDLKTKQHFDIRALTEIYNIMTDGISEVKTGYVVGRVIHDGRMARDLGMLQSDILATLAVMLTVIIFVIPYRRMCLEKITKSKDLQLMTGVSPTIYWLSNFLFDFQASFLIFSPFTVFLSITYISDNSNLIFSDAFATALGFLTYCLVSSYAIFLSYIATFIFNTVSSGLATLMALGFAQAFVGNFIARMYLATGIAEVPSYLQLFLRLILYFCATSPVFQASFFVSSLNKQNYNATFCDDAMSVNPDLCEPGYLDTGYEWQNFNHTCCDPRSLGFQAWFNVGVLPYLILYVPVGLVLAFVVLISIEAVQKKLISRKRRQKAPVIPDEEEDVAAEAKKVEELIEAKDTVCKRSFVVYNLSERIKGKVIIPNLNFLVASHQCFGILGVNGAGKSTALGIMVGQTSRTTGELYLNDLSFITNYKAYRREIGYCPQGDCFIPGTTGEEMLTLMAHLRGVSKEELQRTVRDMIRFLYLEDYASNVVESYSGGAKRKLSIGMALIGWPRLIIMDEPTAEVDPISRKRIWNIIETVKETAGSTLLLATHAMEECETLCDKVTVMIGGRFKILGPIPHLKSKYGEGALITIKLIPNRSDASEVAKAMVMVLSKAIVKYQHSNLIQLHVVDRSVKRGAIYEAVERVKQEFYFEEYEVSDITLEHIFLNLASKVYSKVAPDYRIR